MDKLNMIIKTTGVIDDIFFFSEKENKKNILVQLLPFGEWARLVYYNGKLRHLTKNEENEILLLEEIKNIKNIPKKIFCDGKIYIDGIITEIKEKDGTFAKRFIAIKTSAKYISEEINSMSKFLEKISKDELYVAYMTIENYLEMSGESILSLLNTFANVGIKSGMNSCGILISIDDMDNYNREYLLYQIGRKE